jgi:hypothetical protein
MDTNIQAFIRSCKAAWFEFIFNLMILLFVKLKDSNWLGKHLYYYIIEQMASEQGLRIEIKVNFLHVGDLQGFISLVDEGLRLECHYNEL